MITKEKSLYQVKLILDYLPEEEYKLIPKETIDYIEDNFEYDENFTINPNIPLEKQNIDEKAYDLLEKIVKEAEKKSLNNINQNFNSSCEVAKYIEKVKESNKLYESKIKNFKSNNSDISKYIKKVKESNKLYESKIKNFKSDNSDISKYIKKVKESNKNYDTKIENIRLSNLVKLLKKENEKVPKAKELLEEYKDAIKQKDIEIKNLKKNNEQLYKCIQKIPKFIRKLFIKEFDIKLLN